VLPGGFVVVLSGRVGSAALPRTMRTVVLPPPPEGVVRRSFTARTRGGSPTGSLPPGAKGAYVTFVFASQPKAGQHLTVSWENPAGKTIGTAPKPNRPTVDTGITSGTPLPKGTWHVVLRAGKTIVATHRLVIR
jgi:hypothetical protein